jgi:hypothetical protein
MVFNGLSELTLMISQLPSSKSKGIISFILHQHGRSQVGFCVCLTPLLKLLCSLMLYITLLVLPWCSKVSLFTLVDDIDVLYACIFLYNLLLLSNVLGFSDSCLYSFLYTKCRIIGSFLVDGCSGVRYGPCEYIWINCTAGYILVGRL